MTVAADIAAYWSTDVEAESVTYNYAAASLSGVKGKRTGLSRKEVALSGPAGLEPTDIVWEIGAATMSGTEPNTGGEITDSASAVWSVLSWSALTIGATVVAYRCICKKQ